MKHDRQRFLSILLVPTFRDRLASYPTKADALPGDCLVFGSGLHGDGRKDLRQLYADCMAGELPAALRSDVQHAVTGLVELGLSSALSFGPFVWFDDDLAVVATATVDIASMAA